MCFPFFFVVEFTTLCHSLYRNRAPEPVEVRKVELLFSCSKYDQVISDGMPVMLEPGVKKMITLEFFPLLESLNTNVRVSVNINLLTHSLNINPLIRMYFLPDVYLASNITLCLSPIMILFCTLFITIHSIHRWKV